MVLWFNNYGILNIKILIRKSFPQDPLGFSNCAQNLFASLVFGGSVGDSGFDDPIA
jgi:hypothetical protein